jgi:hypothetical protein
VSCLLSTCRLLWIALALTLLCAAGRAQTETALYNFTRSGDGYIPLGSLVADSDGNYYGTTYAGGLFSGQCSRQGFVNPGCGTVFEISHNGPGGWTLKTLYQFKGQPDGAAPSSSLVLDSQGNLYGTTEYGGKGGQSCDHVGLLGCGTVFRLSPTKTGEWIESIIYDSLPGIGAAYPASLVSDSAGNLYGTLLTQVCSVTACGYVFKLTPGSPGSWVFSIVHAFSHKQGASPSGVTVDSLGNLFVTTREGGIGYGTLVEFTPAGPDSYTMQLLHTFSDSDGRSPLAPVTLDAAGNIYGTASTGGKIAVCQNGCGTVFELSANSDGGYDFSVLYAFSSVKYSYPQTSLVLDAAGKLYGLGGLNGERGFVFEMSPSGANTWTERVVYNFSFHRDTGASPSAYNGLIVDSSGHLFGTLPAYGTPGGCRYGCGVVYQITPK